MNKDWAGWLIKLKGTVPMYAQSTMILGVIAWTTDKSKAIGFKKKSEALAYIESAPLTHEYELVFEPWRRQ